MVLYLGRNPAFRLRPMPVPVMALTGFNPA